MLNCQAIFYVNNKTSLIYKFHLEDAYMRFNFSLVALIFTALAFTILFSTSVFSTPTKTTLICGTNIFPPFSIVENKKVLGLDISIIEQIATELNIEIQIKIFPWPRLLSQVQNGSLDCMFSAFKTPERAERMVFTSNPIHISSLFLYVHKDKKIKYSSIKDLAGLTIGTIRGFALPPEIEALKQADFFTSQEVNTVRQSFQMLDSQRIDAVIYNNHVAEYVLEDMGIDTIISIPNSLQKLPAYVVFSKRSELTPLIERFNQALKTISTNKEASQELFFNSY